MSFDSAELGSFELSGTPENIKLFLLTCFHSISFSSLRAAIFSWRWEELFSRILILVFCVSNTALISLVEESSLADRDAVFDERRAFIRSAVKGSCDPISSPVDTEEALFPPLVGLLLGLDFLIAGEKTRNKGRQLDLVDILPLPLTDAIKA